MNRLSVRLTLAIVATTLLAVGLVALIANRTAGSEFRRYLAAGQMAGSEELAAQVAEAYAQNGSWDGIASALDGVSVVPGRNMNGRGQGGMGRGHGWHGRYAGGRCRWTGGLRQSRSECW